MENLLEIYKQLDELGYVLKPFNLADEAKLYEIFRHVVDSGSQFPYECNSMEEFRRHFFGAQSRVYVCHSKDNEVVACFYIKTNFPGRSRHIANAAYMVSETYRGKGIGTCLVKASLALAKKLGYQAMQFNMVLSNNVGAVKLYERLGFANVGTLSDAVRNPDGSYQDGYIMFRKLEDYESS